MSNASDFIIENGVLTKYVGPGGDVVIPEGVTSIGKGAFSGCHLLTAVTIPNTVASIEDWAFDACGALRDITIQTDAVKIGQKVLSPYNYQYSLHINKLANVSPYYKKFAAFGFAEEDADCTTERGKEHLKYLKSNAWKLVNFAIERPSLLALMCREKLITAKDLEAYTAAAQESGNAQIIALVLEYGAKNISEKEKLKVAKKNDASADEVIERIVARQDKNGICGLVFAVSGHLIRFPNKTELKSCIESKGGKLAGSVSSKIDILITDMVGAGSEKVKKAENLGIEIITEKEFIKRIGSYFVIEDDRLKRYIGCETQVSIPSGITTLEDRAFEDCKDLTDVIVPEGVTMLGCEVFRDCCNLTNIMLPEGLVSISGNAFERCSSLQNIRIPASVKIIGGGAFVDCRNLTDITILNRTTRIGCSAFWNCNRLTIHAPAGSYAETYAKENNIPFVAE